MWLLSWIPDSLLHQAIEFILFGSIGLYVMGFLLRFAPIQTFYSNCIKNIAIIMIIASVYFYGSYNTEQEWRQRMAQAKTVVEQKQLDAKKATVKIKRVYITKEKIIRETQVVVQERIREVEKLIDAECKIDPVVISIHNQAARNPLEGKK